MAEKIETLDYEGGINIDEADRKILGVIANYSKARVSEIARKTGLTRDVVKYRIKKMEDENIIIGYMTIVNPPKFGYKIIGQVFITFRNMDETKERNFLEYLKKHPNVTYICLTGGIYDIMLEITAKNLGHFHKIKREINFKFAEIINSVNILFLLDELKWTHFPGSVMKDFSGRLDQELE